MNRAASGVIPEIRLRNTPDGDRQNCTDVRKHPFPMPAANMSAAYTNPEGVTPGACEYCGHCERFGCEANAKSSRSPASCRCCSPTAASSGRAVVFFEDKIINPFMAAGAYGMNIDDFNGDNFDHGGLGFFGGAWISAAMSNGRPIATRPVPARHAKRPGPLVQA
jgi:hypothetical protein